MGEIADDCYDRALDELEWMDPWDLYPAYPSNQSHPRRYPQRKATVPDASDFDDLTGTDP